MGLTENHAVENALATIGAVLWSIQIIPQLVLSYRTKSTKGLSENLMLIWYFATLFLGAYLVAQRLSIPLQIQPQLFGMFSAVSYAQCLYYGRGFSRLKAGLVLLVLLAVFAGFEAGSVYALWAGQARGVEWPLLMYGYISAALLALGLAPQYWEIYKLRQVIGISLFFLSVDILGGVFSFLSLFFRSDLDIAAFGTRGTERQADDQVSYAGVVVLDSLVILLAFILNPIAKRRGYWIGDKPRPDASAAEAGDARPDVNQGSNTQLDVRPVRSRLSSSGACDRPQTLHSPLSSPESKGGRRAYLNTTDTQDTVVADEQQKREQAEEDARTEAESRGAGSHAAGAEGFEGIRRVEGRLGLT